jgi:hypothetical protein
LEIPKKKKEEIRRIVIEIREPGDNMKGKGSFKNCSSGSVF